MPNNRKITDLPSIVPRSDLKFVVATDANNFSVSLGDISTNITEQLPADLIGQDDLIASGNFLHNYIDDINDALVAADNLLNLDLDSLSGALNTTESELQDKIDIVSGDLFTTGQYLYTAIETVSGDLLASGTLINQGFDSVYQDIASTGASLSGSLSATGEALKSQLDLVVDEQGNLNNQLFDSFNSQFGGTYIYFSDLENKLGPTIKTFYETPTQDIFLSGVTVDSARRCKAYLRWDGPANEYMGTGYINGQQIPFQNIRELGTQTRRFEGFIDNLDLRGKTEITGAVNNITGYISLRELGTGPSATSVEINDISSATPKAGTELGNDALKEGDVIDIQVTYPSGLFDSHDTSVSGIQVMNEGISDGTSFVAYTPAVLGDGSRLYTVPVTISNRDEIDQNVSVRALNNFGSTGIINTSSNVIPLDQKYPVITAADPLSYNGRSDGLRQGESTTFTNNISDFDEFTDTVSYTPILTDGCLVDVNNPDTFELTKTVSYVQGTFTDSDNVEIYAVRSSNGANDTEYVSVKVANGMSVESSEIITPAISTNSPNLIGTTDLKGGDTVNVEVEIDVKDVAANTIQIKVLNSGISDGSQTSFSSYSFVSVAGNVYKYTIPVKVTSSNSRNGNQSVIIQARNSFGVLSAEYTSDNTASVDNVGPSISFSSITYPANQQAIKSGESVTVAHSISNYDSVIYDSPNGQLVIANTSAFESNKVCDYNSGGYNISSANFRATATKATNGIVESNTEVVFIADTPMTLTISGLASKLISSNSGQNYNFSLNSNQKYNAFPTLSVDSSQTTPSLLTHTSQSTNGTNSFRINVNDSHTKGIFNWQVSAFNLAGIETTTVSPSTYNIEGFNSRDIFASPQSLSAGLASIGTSVTNPNNVDLENTSEGGTGPNGGTIYTYKSIANGTQLDFTFDFNNEFTVCDSSGVTDSNGDHIFNLDALSRAANTDVNNPAKYIVSED
jgi:hypothetical protein